MAMLNYYGVSVLDLVLCKFYNAFSLGNLECILNVDSSTSRLIVKIIPNLFVWLFQWLFSYYVSTKFMSFFLMLVSNSKFSNFYKQKFGRYSIIITLFPQRKGDLCNF